MRTGLYDQHIKLGAKMVSFSGWEMPLSYEGIVKEHQNVREKVGIFDVSHMGQIAIEGLDAEKVLDYLCTNQILKKKDFSATYTVWCNASGGSVDDLLVYKKNQEHFFIVVNAANRKKDLQHLLEIAKPYRVKIAPRFEEGILALQGPHSKQLATKIFDEVALLRPLEFVRCEFSGKQVIVSETGYTGSLGVEIFAPMSVIVSLWDRFFAIGESFGLKAIGLGARDTLRQEMGYALYGHELTEEIAPTESVSSWTVRWEKEDFLGKAALEELESSLKKRRQYGIILREPGIAREGYPVYQKDKMIGRVTSGTFSPSLGQAIAIILVAKNLKVDDNVDIQIRNRRCKAQVTKLPFYTKKKSED